MQRTDSTTDTTTAVDETDDNAAATGAGGADTDDGDVERLRRENAQRRRELRAAQSANDELRAELERRRVEQESEQDRAIREAVEARESELRQEFAAERLHNRLRIRAARVLRDPEDAVLHLGATLNPDADNDAIDEALDALIRERDYLAAPANGAERQTAGLVTQGARSEQPGSGGGSPDDWIRQRASR